MKGNNYNKLPTNKDKENFIKENLTNMGFENTMLGSIYLKDMIFEVMNCPTLLHSICTNVANSIAEKYNTTTKCVNGDIVWAIKKAFSKPILNNIACFNTTISPTTKQFVTFLYDYFSE